MNILDEALSQMEYKCTNEIKDVKHSPCNDFPYDVPVHNIKTENDDVINDSFVAASDTNGGNVSSTLCGDVATQDIKAELIEESSQISSVVVKSEPKDVLHNIKVENNELIVPEIVHSENVIDKDAIHISVSPENVCNYGIKFRQNCEIQQDSIRYVTNADVEHEDVFVGGVDSPKNSLPLENARWKHKPSTMAAQEVTKTTPALDDRHPCSDGIKHSNVQSNSSMICNNEFRSTCDFNGHLRTHSDLKAYSYDTCKKAYEQKSSLIQHSTTMYSGAKKYTCDNVKVFSTKPSITKRTGMHSAIKPYSCVVCDKTFTHKSVLTNHMATHSNVKPYSCNICHTTFKQKFNLTGHMRAHSGGKPYSCDVCNKAFKLKSTLVGHMRTHSDVKPYSCDICYSSFKRKYLLKVHMRTHSGVKPYTCDVCNKSFIEKSTLNVHLRTHSGVKSYSCDVCNKSFTQKSQLTNHMNTHSNVKRYLCDICQTAFKQKCNLNAHLRTHSGVKPYSCEVCNKAFTQKSHLTSHMVTHSTVKPYPCNVCSKAFSAKCSLAAHSKSHSVVKSYMCDVCNRQYKQKYHLTLHLRTKCQVKL